HLTGHDNLRLGDVRIQIEIGDLIEQLNWRCLRLIAQTELEGETGADAPVVLRESDETPIAKVSVGAAELQLRGLRHAEKEIREIDAQLSGHGLAGGVELAGHEAGKIEVAAGDGIGLIVVLHAAHFPTNSDAVLGQNVCDGIAETQSLVANERRYGIPQTREIREIDTRDTEINRRIREAIDSELPGNIVNKRIVAQNASPAAAPIDKGIVCESRRPRLDEMQINVLIAGRIVPSERQKIRERIASVGIEVVSAIQTEAPRNCVQDVDIHEITRLGNGGFEMVILYCARKVGRGNEFEKAQRGIVLHANRNRAAKWLARAAGIGKRVIELRDNGAEITTTFGLRGDR
ncbi:MAG: hypothetical protein ACREDR_45865, partial [Blastocatellia bacterium]